MREREREGTVMTPEEIRAMLRPAAPESTCRAGSTECECWPPCGNVVAGVGGAL